MECHQQALELRTGPHGKGRSLHNIASLYGNISAKQKAVELFQEALIYRRKADDHLGEANTLNKLGMLQYALGERTSGLMLLEQSFSILQESRSPGAERVLQQIQQLKSGFMPAEIEDIEQPEPESDD